MSQLVLGNKCRMSLEKNQLERSQINFNQDSRQCKNNGLIQIYFINWRLATRDPRPATRQLQRPLTKYKHTQLRQA